MPNAIAMPKLGMTMSEGRVIEWTIPLGEPVEKGRLLLIIESEKAEVEIEAAVSGTLRHIYVESDETVPCGTLLAAVTETPDEPFDAEAFRREHSGPEPAPTRAVPRAEVQAAPARGPKPQAGGALTPAARRLPRRLGVDAGSIPGSGPGGRITREDVEDFAARASARVEVQKGVFLEVPSQGTGDPVLLLPGFGTDVAVFARQQPALSERYRVLGVNPRGVGLSDAPDETCTAVAASAADAAAVSETPAHVIGASLGAAVAIELALSYPERVRSLTLLTPVLEADARLLAVLEAWCRLAAEASPETLARALLPWLFSSAFLADVGARERTARGLASVVGRVPVATLERSAAGLRAWSGTRREALSGILAPTLVLAAGNDLLARDARAVAEAIPGAREVVIPEAGHALGLEAPDAVNAAVLSHLDAVSGEREPEDTA